MRRTVHYALVAAVLAIAPLAAARAQGNSSVKSPAHPKVCAEGVQVFESKADIPAPYDTLVMPKGDGPIRVNSPEEAEQAMAMVKERAGSIGATGILQLTETEEVDGGVRMHRSITPVFSPSDTARAYAACRKG